MLWSYIFLVALGTLTETYGYESGAPQEACADMIPQHHTQPQTSPFPYIITLQKKEIAGGEKLNLMISATDVAKTFKGFFVQARVGNIPVGKFDPSPGVKLIDCGNSESSGATHASAEKKNYINLTWNAPPGLSEIIRFRVTVALDGGTFWVGHLSSPIIIKSQ